MKRPICSFFFNDSETATMSSSATRFVQFLNRFAQRFSSAPRRIERKQRFGSHGYQALEDRRLLAVFVVNTITDDLSAQPDGLLSPVSYTHLTLPTIYSV